MCLAVCESVSGAANDALATSAAIELVQNFCDIHDDLQSGRVARDGRDAVWWRWGPAQAINAGDGMHALARMALLAMMERGFDSDATFDAVRLLDNASLATCEGRFTELEAQERLDMSSDAYLRMARAKTGSLFACAAEFGALSARADGDARSALAEMGASLGAALQIGDDLRQLEESLSDGGAPSDDVMNKRKLYPVVRAFETATTSERRRLGDYYFKRVLEPADARALARLVDEMGGMDGRAPTGGDAAFRRARKSGGGAFRRRRRRGRSADRRTGGGGVMATPNMKSVRDLPLGPGTRVLVRVDYNVPFKPGTREISDDSRISATLPTIRYLTNRGCRVILCSHLGRPRGRRNADDSLAPVAMRLSELLGARAPLVGDCVGPEVWRAMRGMAYGSALMLENLRFHAGEEANDGAFAARLAELADFYVNDGFGAAHRRHASTYGVAKILPSAAGLLMEREIAALGRVTRHPDHPYAVVVGGAKVADKLPVIENLSGVADVFLIGGGMVAAFLSAAGCGWRADADERAAARRILEGAARGGYEVVLPVDVVVAEGFAEDARARTVGVGGDFTPIPTLSRGQAPTFPHQGEGRIWRAA